MHRPAPGPHAPSPRVIIVDDRADVGRALEHAIVAVAPAARVAHLASAAGLAAAAEAIDAQVVVLEPDAPGPDPLEAARALVGGDPPRAVLVLTASGRRDQIAAALEAGVSGVLLKDEPPAVIVDAITALAEGRRSGIGVRLFSDGVVDAALGRAPGWRGAP